MTNDEVKRLLKNYSYFAEDIKHIHKKQAEILELLEDARQTVLKAQVLSKTPTSKGIADKFKLVDKYNDMLQDLNEQESVLQDKKKWIDKAYSNLEFDEKRIIKYRYFDYMSFYQIGYQIRKDKSVAFRLHEDVITKIRNIIT